MIALHCRPEDSGQVDLLDKEAERRVDCAEAEARWAAWANDRRPAARHIIGGIWGSDPLDRMDIIDIHGYPSPILDSGALDRACAASVRFWTGGRGTGLGKGEATLPSFHGPGRLCDPGLLITSNQQ